MTSPKKVLIVEDQEADQFIAKRNLGRRWPEAELLLAFDGEQAIEILEGNMDSLPDLILLDINMPRMNGHEFLEEWSNRHRSEIPVIVMLTSSELKSDSDRAQQYPFVKDCILKPLNKTTLESLSDVLDE